MLSHVKGKKQGPKATGRFVREPVPPPLLTAAGPKFPIISAGQTSLAPSMFDKGPYVAFGRRNAKVFT
jgi:hypothetical protein